MLLSLFCITWGGRMFCFGACPGTFHLCLLQLCSYPLSWPCWFVAKPSSAWNKVSTEFPCFYKHLPSSVSRWAAHCRGAPEMPPPHQPRLLPSPCAPQPLFTDSAAPAPLSACRQRECLCQMSSQRQRLPAGMPGISTQAPISRYPKHQGEVLTCSVGRRVSRRAEGCAIQHACMCIVLLGCCVKFSGVSGC